LNKSNPLLPEMSLGFRESNTAAMVSDEDEDLPLRAELFSAAQMAAHGRSLASHHELSPRGGGDQLLARLSDNAEVISATCDELTAAIKDGRQITPASEWLLDNLYLIEEQIRIARRHLPKDYSKELPRLAKGAPEGCPRVYKLALEIISHGDGRVDPESLSRFVDAYQEIAPLKLGELWAIPIMLRLALIENLRRLAAGAAAQDVLLWGARGTGKSSLIKAAVGAVQAEGGAIALVEVAALDTLPQLFARLASVPRAFALFLDDLGVEAPAEGRILRSLLEGGAEARPANVRLLVTANRRHLMPRDIEEQSSAINPRDSIDDQLALADRFGLSLGFHALDQDGYCAIVAGYAARYDLPFDAAEAINWATRRGSRSGRVAWQYVTEVAGRLGRSLP